MQQTFWIFDGGDHGGVVGAREIAVAVKEVVLRVHEAEEVGEVWAHNMCLGLG